MKRHFHFDVTWRCQLPLFIPMIGSFHLMSNHFQNVCGAQVMWHAKIRARGHRKACHFIGQRKQMIFRTAVAHDIYLLSCLWNRCSGVRIHWERESQLWSCTQQVAANKHLQRTKHKHQKHKYNTNNETSTQITNEITQIIEVRMYKEKERRLSPCTQCRNLQTRKIKARNIPTRYPSL